MIAGNLLTQPITIRGFSDGAALDAHRRPVRSAGDERVVLGYLEQTGALEILVGRETYISDAKAMLPPDDPVTPADELVVAGVTYQIVGPIARSWDPLRSSVDHLELTLRSVA